MKTGGYVAVAPVAADAVAAGLTGVGCCSLWKMKLRRRKDHRPP